MTAYSPSSSYGHSIAATGSRYVLRWRHTRFQDGAPREFEVERMADYRGALLFAKRWDLPFGGGA